MSDIAVAAAPAPAPASAAPKAKTPKAPKAPKAAKPKAAGAAKPGHSYVELIKDAIVTLKERGGSSLPAIKKAVEAKGLGKSLGAGWEKRLSMAIKAMVKSGKLNKVGRALV